MSSSVRIPHYPRRYSRFKLTVIVQVYLSHYLKYAITRSVAKDEEWQMAPSITQTDEGWQTSACQSH